MPFALLLDDADDDESHYDQGEYEVAVKAFQEKGSFSGRPTHG